MSKDFRTDARTSDVPSVSVSQNSDSDFETAISACGIGCFNICLAIASMSTAISAIYTTSSISFILPIAECDLQLNLMDKGYLNSMSFAGMISSAIPWGYIADTRGRKIVMVYALILDGIIVAGCGICQTLNQLLILKFFDGFLICGPFAVVMSYVSEFHGLQHRARMMMIIGMHFSSAAIVLPILAICILPYQFSLQVSSFKIHNWHVFLLTTAIVPFFGGILNSFFPESPKFLMSQGRNDEALECLRTIYALNYRKPRNEYPITNLIDEDPEKTKQHLIRKSIHYNTLTHHRRQTAKEKLKAGLQQLRPMFSNPHLKQSIQVYSMFFLIHLGLNSIRLWLPQIFVTMEEFEAKKLGCSKMCQILSYNYNKTILLAHSNNTVNCDLRHISVSSYIDNVIVAVASFLLYLIAVFVINKLGSNMVLRISLCLAFFTGILMYFSKCRLMTLILASIYTGVMCVATTNVVNASVNLFPTQMRTMVIIIMMTFGRCGSLLGNILFPWLISLGCIPPFMQIGGTIAVGFILSLFLPSNANTALK